MRSAVAGLISAGLSQVIVVIGLGNSWSQPLLAKRPSQIVGSGRKTISNEDEAVPPVIFNPPSSIFSATVLGGSALLAISPSCSALRQAASSARPCPCQ